MKARYGKISIGCFAAIWIAYGILSSMADSECTFLMIVVGPVCLFLGFLFGIIGMVRDWSKSFSVLGFLLSLVGALFWVLFFR